MQGLIFDDDREKILRGVTLYGVGSLSLAVSGDRNGVSKEIQLSKDGVFVELDLRGASFDLRLEMSDVACIDQIEFEYQYIGAEV